MSIREIKECRRCGQKSFYLFSCVDTGTCWYCGTQNPDASFSQIQERMRLVNMFSCDIKFDEKAGWSLYTSNWDYKEETTIFFKTVEELLIQMLKGVEDGYYGD